MKVYPVGHGNHDNMYFIAKEKDLLYIHNNSTIL